MTTHALTRLRERYGRDLSKIDIVRICSGLEKGRYLHLADFKNTTDKVKVLIKYNDIPLKLVYSKSQNKIITALPLDVDEYNDYFDMVPELGISANNINYNDEMKNLMNAFHSKFENKTFYHYVDIIREILSNKDLNIDKASEHFVIIWFETKEKCIANQIFSKNQLKRRIRQKIIDLLTEDRIDIIRTIIDFYERLIDE